MSRKTEYTLILVTDRVVVRADFSGSATHSIAGEPQIQDRVNDSSLVDCIRRILDNHHLPHRRVLVLSTHVWNQIVSIPRASIESLPADQLAEVLKFEVEPLVGIDADLATLGFAEIDGDQEFRRFWTNVTNQLEWDAVRDDLKSRKIRDVVLAHPIVASGPQPRSRIEFWDQSVFHLDQDGGLIQINNSPAGATRWVADFGFESLERVIQNESIVLAPEYPQSETYATCPKLTDLSRIDSLTDWLHDALMRLNAFRDTDLPVIRQIRKSSQSWKEWVLRAAAMLLVVGFCGWHLTWQNIRLTDIQHQITEFAKPGIEKQKFDTLLGEVMQKRQTAIESSMTAKAELQQVRFFFEHQTDRLHTLLLKLMEYRTSELVIKGIEVTEKGTVVSGVSLNGDSAPLLTNRLRDTFSSAGWEIHPASQQGLLKMNNGGPWTFSILLEDVGPPSLVRETRGNLATSLKKGGTAQ